MSEPKKKRSFASGFIFGAISFCFAVAIIAALAIPNFVRPQVSGGGVNLPCIVCLREIDAAKNEWALEHHAKPGDIVTTNDIAPYFLHYQIPKCPQGGIYTIGKVGEHPTCSIAGNHTLPAY